MLHLLADILKMKDVIIIKYALEILNEILKEEAEDFKEMKYRLEFQKIGGANALEELLYHKNNKISDLCNIIVENYYSSSEEIE